jgi:hypothetical protein
MIVVTTTSTPDSPTHVVARAPLENVSNGPWMTAFHAE